MATRPAEAWWVLARRWLVLVLAAVLMAVGVLTVVGQVSRLVRPGVEPGPGAVAPEEELVGTAVVVAVDYLSWDQGGRDGRRRALARVAAPGVSIDGWGADGRQLADSPAVLGVVRLGADGAVVTVRVRVVAFEPARGPAPRTTMPVPSATADDGGANVASGSGKEARGWVSLPARWWDLAVPVARVSGQVVVPGTPALVGSPSRGAVLATAAPDSADSQFGAATRALVERLMRAYGADDLQFVRAPGTSFRGLAGPVGLERLVEWRVAALAAGDGGERRQGEVTVVWELPGGSSLRCVYRLELQRLDDRWLLAAVDVAASQPR